MGIGTYGGEHKSSSNSIISQEKLNKILVDSDVKELKKLITTISKKYNLTPENITSVISKEEEIQIPTSIFSDKNLSSLELTVKYLKEELNLKYSVIARLVNRDERTIWATYNNSLKKSKKRLEVSESVLIPIKVLSDRNFSILEKAVGYLKEDKSLKFFEIAKILRRDDRTVWTCYSRLKKKREGENEAR